MEQESSQFSFKFSLMGKFCNHIINEVLSDLSFHFKCQNHDALKESQIHETKLSLIDSQKMYGHVSYYRIMVSCK